jgi:hypothetical protein
VAVAVSSSHFVSLMADGVRKAGRRWLGICLATVETLSFWRLVDETDQKSASIADALAETIRDLQNRGFTVCFIVTDNASNECAVSNPLYDRNNPLYDRRNPLYGRTIPRLSGRNQVSSGRMRFKSDETMVKSINN